MPTNLHLNPAGVTAAVDHIVVLLLVFLFMAIAAAWKATTLPAIGAETDSTFQERTKIRAKLLALVMIAPGIIILVAISGDLVRLAITFPLWGVFVLLLTLLVIWIIGGYFFLSQDDIGDYTIESDHRASIDARWQAEKKAKTRLRFELFGWSAGVLVAIVWLLALAHTGLLIKRPF